ncbi:MAG: hypothetical protein ACRYGI_07165 [Janthinobacterium lividum]
MSKPERPVERPSKLPDFTPFIVLAALLGLLLLGLYLFPMFKTMMVYQDCVASGRVDCARK